MRLYCNGEATSTHAETQLVGKWDYHFMESFGLETIIVPKTITSWDVTKLSTLCDHKRRIVMVFHLGSQIVL